jgi:hypothetical protein
MISAVSDAGARSPGRRAGPGFHLRARAAGRTSEYPGRRPRPSPQVRARHNGLPPLPPATLLALQHQITCFMTARRMCIIHPVRRTMIGRNRQRRAGEPDRRFRLSGANRHTCAPPRFSEQLAACRLRTTGRPIDHPSHRAARESTRFQVRTTRLFERPHSVKARQRKHDRVHDQGRYADLRQGMGCRATDRLQPRVTGALDSHVTGRAWTVHPIGAR